MSAVPVRLSSTTTDPSQVEADWLVVGIFEGSLTPALSAFDAKLGGAIAKIREAGDFQAKPNELLAIHSPTGIKAKRLLLVGLAKSEEASRASLHDAASSAVRRITGRKVTRVALLVPETPRVTFEQSVLAFGVGARQGSHGPGVRKTEPSRFSPDEIILVVPAGRNVEATVNRAAIEGDALTLARTLVNSPPCDLYPETFAAQIAEIARGSGIDVEIWDERRLEAEGMGAIVGIAQGSTRPARLAILRYNGGGSGTLAYVGKGVTFDSGGLSLKTNDQMLDMKCDMAGAAAAFAATVAIARLKLPINLLTVMPLVENMPSGYAVKLGDVLKSRNGKTIEILNTDAEGRVILADALAYAAEQKVSHIVDLATLTGAVMIALGTEIAGLMSNDDGWAGKVLGAIRQSGERAWQLPMDRDFEEALKSNVADCKNAPGVRYGGSITGGKFLEQFVNKIPWVHLDIAGPAWAEKESAAKDAGGTGAYVRSLIELAHVYAAR
ncbi:MAG: leucyl aminopeptidase [Planctomycetes bacterium]|nr:leucyl aminopeptidase [Planctomycetota bacterium]